MTLQENIEARINQLNATIIDDFCGKGQTIVVSKSSVKEVVRLELDVFVEHLKADNRLMPVLEASMREPRQEYVDMIERLREQADDCACTRSPRENKIERLLREAADMMECLYQRKDVTSPSLDRWLREGKRVPNDQ